METSRRSTTNLPRLSIGPLSSISPLEISDASTTDHDSPQWPRHTYMSGRSAPTTPGILSHHGSNARLNSKSFTHLAFSTDTIGGGGGGGAKLSKSKSTTVLLPGLASRQQKQQQQQQRRKKLRYSGLTKAATVATDNGEWLFRAGAAITSEARESKGQSWLVSRESSTSLVALDDEEDTTYNALQDKGTFSPNYSRSVSRAASTRTSRRPSGVGSRPDLTSFTPLASRTPVREMMAGHYDYFGDLRESSTAVVIGPDFVDEQDDEDDGSDVDEELRDRLAEAEVAKLTQDRGFGLGGLVDKFIGWTLFDAEDEGRDKEEEEDELKGSRSESPVQTRLAEVPLPQKARSVERATAPRPAQEGRSVENVDGGDVEGQGGWSDAAWLLSVASKVLL